MKIFIKLLLTISFVLGLSLNSLAQENCKITGTVIDNKGEAISYASVAIYDSNKAITGGLTDENGNFYLKIGRSGEEYRLSVEFIGYKAVEQNIRPNSSSINLGKIILKERAYALSESIVSSRVENLKSSVEHTSINASSNIVHETGSAIDILSTSPAITVLNDAVSIRGNSNILVLIDGIPTTINDLASIPARSIKNIEIITNPDASFDAEGTGGIINIISKKESRSGFSSIVSANYGFNHFVTGNIAFSFNNPKTSYRFTYNTKYEDDLINTTLNRFIKHSNKKTFQEIEASRYVFNNNINLSAEFNLNDKNSLNIDIKSMFPRLNIKQNLYNTFTNNGTINKELRHNDITWNRENIEAAISYKHIFIPNISDLSIKSSISKTWGHRPSYYYLEGAKTNRSNSGGSPFNSAFQLDYQHKLKAGTISAGAKFTYRHNDIYHKFYTFKDDSWEYSESLSNDLIHTELIPAAFILFSSKIGEQFTYKAGLRGEFSTVTLNSKHERLKERNNDFFLAPSISGTYRIKENRDISFAFSRRIGRPIYPQLNPYMSMVDATTFEQGNMNLQPEKSSKLDISYSHSSKFFSIFTDLYINHTHNYISQISKVEEDLLVTTYINALSDFKSGAEISIKLLPLKWLNIGVNTNTFYTKITNNLEGADINNKGWTNNSNMLVDFIIGKNTDIQLQYFLTTPQYYPQLTTSLTHYMNIGAKQRLFKGAMTLSILLTDIFNTNNWEVHSYNKVFDLTNYSTRKSRMLWLGISYNFNSFKAKKSESTSGTDRSLIKLGL